ncbi:YbaB/EbfC family nucleoid-associated protein [Nakamurella multipartita]|nr:YbaB/EbfC family nucleoid-associated protein [Nakamurella multipartita]
MPDFSQILIQAQQMQAEMERAQASLSEQEVTGTAGGGLVTAVLTGGGDLVRLSIDPSVVDPAEVETLEDLIVAAVHDARRAAQDIANDTMGAAANGLAGSLDLSAMGLSLPGFGPESLDQDDDDDDDFEDDEDFDEDDLEEDGLNQDDRGRAEVIEIDVITIDTVVDEGGDDPTGGSPRPLSGPDGR